MILFLNFQKIHFLEVSKNIIIFYSAEGEEYGLHEEKGLRIKYWVWMKRKMSVGIKFWGWLNICVSWELNFVDDISKLLNSQNLISLNVTFFQNKLFDFWCVSYRLTLNLLVALLLGF